MINRPTQLLLNVGHAIDHGFLLIFATAVTSIASEFGIGRWEDMMPYSVAAFFCFGVGALPAGRLGDQWGRRPMMIAFFIGIGVAAILVAAANSPLQIALALALLGCAASIYHPVAIPMLIKDRARPGWIIGVNGLAGNLGVALAAAITGLLVKYFGWRVAFLVPGVASIACGLLFAWVTPRESAAPAKKMVVATHGAGISISRLMLVLTIASTAASMLFNFATSSNYELLASRMLEVSRDPARLGLLLALAYAIGSLMQLLVGKLIDTFSIKAMYLILVALQALFLALAAITEGWFFYTAQVLFMASIFGVVPFTDALIARYVDDSMRSRVSGMRFAVSLGGSSLAVWLIGPVVKQSGFTTLLWAMTAIAALTMVVLLFLPSARRPA